MRLLLLIFVFQSFVSCKQSGSSEKAPDCRRPSQTYYITDPGSNQAKFKTGTYWVFYDSITSTIDSNVVYEHSSGFSKPPLACDDSEYWFFRVKRYNPFEWGHEWYSIDPRGMGLNPMEHLFDPNIYSPVLSNSSLSTHVRLDSIFVYDRYYKNVEMSTFFNDPVETGNKAVYYFNPEFGFLRKDLFNASNQLTRKRLLIRKNIIR